MKVGEAIPVSIAGQTVAQAKITHMEEGKVTLVVPGTIVVMATRTQIDTPEPVEPVKETIVTGVERTSNDTSAETSETSSDVQRADNVQQQTTEPDSATPGAATPGAEPQAEQSTDTQPVGETTEVGTASQVEGAGSNE